MVSSFAMERFTQHDTGDQGFVSLEKHLLNEN